jgi:hypothetical protein
MGRLIPLRHRRSNLYAVKETIAALNEELEFTLNYAEAMTRREHYHAAAEVIEQQRRSLARASERMHRAAAEAPQPARSRFRGRAALAGVAAALAIASGAFASLGGSANRAPVQNPRITAIQQANEALKQVSAISDPVALQTLVAQAQNTILDIAQTAPTDPSVKQSLLDTIESLKKAVTNPNIPAKVREQAKKVAERVENMVTSTTEVPEQTATTDASTDAGPTPTPSV